MPTAAHVPKYKPVFRKAAAGDDQTFEASLAAIGRSTINGRAPSVARHEIGFQVLDKDDDNTRAVGVFGYRIGGKLYYVPMFYRDGVTKGVEQLRDPKRKRTVPLTDNWVNQLAVEHGDESAKPISRSRMKDTAQPSLWQLKYPPSKWARAEPEWVPGVRSDLAHALAYGGQFTAPVDAPDLMKVAAAYPAVMAGLNDLVRLYPWFGEAVLAHHPAAKVAAALDAAVPRVPPRARRAAPRVKAAAPKVTVIRVSRFTMGPVPSAALDYAPDELRELRAGRNAYADKRGDDEVSVVEGSWVGRAGGGSSLMNPGCSGVYQVLCRDMKLHACAVLTNLAAWESAPNDCFVVRLADGAWARKDRNAVWALANSGVDTEAAEQWHAGLRGGTEVPTHTRVSAVFLAPGRHLFASVPFCIDGDGHVHQSWDWARSSYWASAGRTVGHDPRREEYDCHKKVRMTDTAARLVVQSNCLYMPGKGQTKFLVLEDKPHLQLADGDDPDNFLVPQIKAAAEGAAVVSVEKAAHGTFAVAGARGAGAGLSAPDAEALLVERHALRPAAARHLVEGAARYKAAHAVLRYPAVKAADEDFGGPNRLETGYPNAPNVDDPALASPAMFADDVVPSQAASSIRVTVPDADEQAGSMERYRPYPVDNGVEVPVPGIGNSGDVQNSTRNDGLTSADVDAVAGAARSGVKELFDTAAVAVLVKRTRIDTVIDKVVRAATSWMNGAADCLCHMYWNVDDWSGRFGQNEVGPMEDQIRDHFEGIGDLVLNFQEKSVNAGRDFGLLPKLDSVDAAGAAGG